MARARATEGESGLIVDVATALAGWSAAPGPLHRRLSKGLSEAIGRGELPAGARLPSERGLARRLVVSRSTVVAAYDTLVSEGLIESRHGSGTYVTGARGAPRSDRPTASAPILHRLLDDSDAGATIISLATASVPPTSELGPAMARAIDEDLSGLCLRSGYQPLGVPQLRTAVAEAMCEDGVSTDPSQVIITTGAHQALNLCASVLVRPGDWVAMEDPTYPGSIDAFAAAGGRLVPIEVDGEGMIPESLERALAERSVAAICVTPAFHNPTGTLLPLHRRRRLVEIAARYAVPIVEDHVLTYAQLSGFDAMPQPLAACAADLDVPVFTVGSASKVFWSGLRIGWIRADEPWFTRLARRKAAADLGSSVLDQAVTARLFAQLPGISTELRSELIQRLTVCETSLAAGLPGWSWERPRGGASLWIDLGTEASRFSQVALRHGVEVIPGTAFSISGRWADYIRLPFTLPPRAMKDALERLHVAWANYRPDGEVEPRADDPAVVV